MLNKQTILSFNPLNVQQVFLHNNSLLFMFSCWVYDDDDVSSVTTHLLIPRSNLWREMLWTSIHVDSLVYLVYKKTQ
jgi:hypothetical protein